MSSGDEYTDIEDFEPMVPPVKEIATQSKTTANRQISRPASRKRPTTSISAPSHDITEAPTTAESEHVDLTRSDEDNDSTMSQMEAQSGPSAATALNADRTWTTHCWIPTCSRNI